MDGTPISDDELTMLLNEVRWAVDGVRHPAITFFEAATSIGFLHFVRRRVDAAVVEVGLGGRFDSTNVCRPAVAIVTSISLDHTRQLGDHVAAIAMEKAGIIKAGRPTVSGATASEARPVIEGVCRSAGRRSGSSASISITNMNRVASATGGAAFADASRHTRASLAVDGTEPARRTSGRQRLRWSWPALKNCGPRGGRSRTPPWPAVWPVRSGRANGEVLGRRPWVVLDCAHNPASAETLVRTLLESFPSCRRLLVFAGSSDKDVAGMFRVLAPHFRHAFLTRYVGSTRSTPPEQLAELWRKAGGPPPTLCPSPAAAWESVRNLAEPDDLICAMGSVFLAGEMRPLLMSLCN